MFYKIVYKSWRSSEGEIKGNDDSGKAKDTSSDEVILSVMVVWNKGQMYLNDKFYVPNRH